MNEQIYAESLHKMIEDGKTPKAAVTALRQSLEKSGRAALFSRIARAFKRIMEREDARHAMTLRIGGKDAAHAKSEAKHVLSEMNIDMKDVQIVEDDTLIGGWRLEGGENLYDASFKKHLLSLYNRTTQS